MSLFTAFTGFASFTASLRYSAGTCGAPIDPALKPALYPQLGALVVIAGGGDGIIVGGTGKYKPPPGIPWLAGR